MLVAVGGVDDPTLAATRKAGEYYRVYLPPDTTIATPGLLLRTVAAAGPLLPAIRNAAAEEAPGLVVRARTLADVQDEERKIYRIVTGGLSAAGLIALLVSALGLYAVVAFSVGQRTREIAVRMAVGAARSQIVRRFVWDGLRLSAPGLAFGLPVSLLGLHFLIGSDLDIPVVGLPLVTTTAALGVRW